MRRNKYLIGRREMLVRITKFLYQLICNLTGKKLLRNKL